MRNLPSLAPAAAGVAAAVLLVGITLLSSDLLANDKSQPVAPAAPRSAAPVPATGPLQSQVDLPGRPSESRTQSLPQGLPQSGPQCLCPGNKPDKEQLWPQPKVVELKPHLDPTDEIAALEAIQLALSEVGDGSTYVWHRTGGRLSGIVRPTTSFRGDAGRVCRHVVFLLTAGTYSKQAEGIACRGSDGIWSLDG